VRAEDGGSVRRTFRGLLAAGAVAAVASALPAHAAAAPALPDGRAYELVSPLENRAVEVDNAWTTPDGEHALSANKSDYVGLTISTRGADGWSSIRIGLDPPGSNRQMLPYLNDVSDDVSRLLIDADPAGDPVERGELWLRTADAEGTWTRVGGDIRYAGGSSDLGTLVVVPSRAGYVPFPELGSRSGVFRWQDGEVASIGDDAPRVAACGATVADGLGVRSYDQSGVSADGRTVVLTNATGGADCTDPDTGGRYLPHVLVWRDGETVDVSAAVDPATDAAATYVGNAADGSAVFFTTAAKLEQDDANGVADLYRYDVEQDELLRVSAATTAAGAPVKTAISADEGRTAWFVTALSADLDALWWWTKGSRPQLVTAARTGAFAFLPLGTAADRQTQLTPDGRVVVWETTARIGGYTGSGRALVRATADGAVDCVSCTATGGSSARFGNAAPTGLQIPLGRISADGETVVFETSLSLVPEDTGSRPDVYAWHDGTVSLISSGDNVSSKNGLAGISRDGDIFFRDASSLLPWIESDRSKVWTARVGGGFPAPAAPLPGCADETCQGEPSARVEPVPSGSATHSAPDDADDPEPSWAPDPAVKVAKVSAAAKRRLAHGKAIALTVRSTAAGRVTATVRIKVGKRWVRSGGAARTLRSAGTTKLSVRLGRQARRTLARRGALRVRIDVAHPQAEKDARTAFVLKQKTAGRGR
jgi:hypothetical protein